MFDCGTNCRSTLVMSCDKSDEVVLRLYRLYGLHNFWGGLLLSICRSQGRVFCVIGLVVRWLVWGLIICGTDLARITIT